MLIVTVYGLHRYQIFETNERVEQATPLPVLEDLELRSSKFVTDDKSSIKKETPTSISTSTSRTSSNNWLEKVALLKEEKRYDEIMMLCAEQYPLWSAYNQTCIALRSKLRSLGDDHPEQPETLEKLYNTAVLAEFIHDKSPDAQRLSLAQLKLLDLSTMEKLRFDYSSLGYANLRLIRKGDVKRLLSWRGRPQQHQNPRKVYQDTWERLSQGI